VAPAIDGSCHASEPEREEIVEERIRDPRFEPSADVREARVQIVRRRLVAEQG
jgi:hypothetical protein